MGSLNQNHLKTETAHASYPFFDSTSSGVYNMIFDISYCIYFLFCWLEVFQLRANFSIIKETSQNQMTSFYKIATFTLLKNFFVQSYLPKGYLWSSLFNRTYIGSLFIWWSFLGENSQQFYYASDNSIRLTALRYGYLIGKFIMSF